MNEDSELPEGWSIVPFEDGIEYVIGGEWGKDESDKPQGWVEARVIRGTEFREWEKNKGSTGAVRYIKPASLTKRQLREGDLVIEISGGGPDQPVGRTALIDNDTVAKTHLPLTCSNFCRLVRLKPFFVSSFLNYCLRWKYCRREFDAFQNQTVNIRNLEFPRFAAETLIPIPPLAEQHRIVAAVERILARVSSARERLERVPATMKRFRQAVLAAACSGRLTADWRIRDTVADDIDDVPACWKRTSLMELIVRIEAGKSFRCHPRQAELNEWGIIKVSAMTWGEFDPSENKAILPETEFNPAHEIRPLDVLFSRSNTEELAGATVLVRHTRSKLLLSDKSLRLVPRENVRPEWLWRALQSPDARSQLSGMASGTSNSMRNISQEKLSSLQLVLPPLSEQQEIERRVAALFTFADNIQQRAASALRRVESLTQSVLAKAFRGELVPTEAEVARREGRTYETADKLLERIRSEAGPKEAKKKAKR